MPDTGQIILKNAHEKSENPLAEEQKDAEQKEEEQKQTESKTREEERDPWPEPQE